jgi:hypothetical protein
LPLRPTSQGCCAPTPTTSAAALDSRLQKGLPMDDDAKLRRRSGSETRQKQHRITVRYNAAEFAELEEAAEAQGLTVGSYVRSRTLAAPATRSRRRPTVEVAEITRLQGALNRIGTNIHGLLKDVRFGGTPGADEARAAFAGYREAIAAVLAALGRGKT